MESFDAERIRKHLENAEFTALFIEGLGWDQPPADERIVVNNEDILLEAVAEKHGLVVYRCRYEINGGIPDSGLRRKIDNALTKRVREHLIIFSARDNSRQEWQWVRREHGKPAALRTSAFNKGQKNESLIQKLRGLYFSLEEEENITLLDTISRVRENFDVEKVTRRFYDEFTEKHKAFLRFIDGIPDEEFRRWYASVMLNRLMFIYFLQKKGFLDNDLNYLRTKLQQVKKDGGGYYRQFLYLLFFQGFAKKEQDRSPEARKLLGDIPYLNGGLFNRHEVEDKYGPEINISDKAFEELFGFFDNYDWHLDERPRKKDNEINPDVLGYIFEKYINQKQMGAYYTKEDITGYIARNTILPWLFEFTRKKCKVAFEPNSYLWRLLKDDPDRYIYEAARHGVDQELPEGIAAGIKDVSKRTDWNKKAPEKYALPTEIWREVVARRQRYQEIRTRIDSGQIQNIEDFITYNLDIEKFALSAMRYAEGPEFVRAFWQGLQSISVLDPACGSGAFLFAALNILKKLYEACLYHMQTFVDALARSPSRAKTTKLSDFRDTLARTQEHPNRTYFIYKTIIVFNLYGVDIMDEAIEICKLRLFLKLAAQLESAEKIEPLPDIDFNIKAGNSLIGYTSFKDVEKTVEGKLQFDDTLEKLRTRTQDLDNAFTLFRQQQTELGGEITAEHKDGLKSRLMALEEELNLYLAKDYGIDLEQKSDQKAYEQWKHSHRPFHWLIEFYGIISDGGFDVIIGNPPYVKYKKVKQNYIVQRLETLDCANLYGFFAEKSGGILDKKNGVVSLIVPLSIFSTPNMQKVKQYIMDNFSANWISYYSNRPDQLFEGAQNFLCIYISKNSNHSNKINTTALRRWASEFRPFVFPTNDYVNVNSKLEFPDYSAPKFFNVIENSIWKKIKTSSKKPLSLYVSNTIQSNQPIVYCYGGVYWTKARNFTSYVIRNSQKAISTADRPLCVRPEYSPIAAVAILNSSIHFWFWVNFSDCRNKTYNVMLDLPISDSVLNDPALIKAGNTLMKDYKTNSVKKVRDGRNRTSFTEFYPKKSKPIIDKIDWVLAKHYGFTDEELDFIINYDIKYRLGADE